MLLRKIHGCVSGELVGVVMNSFYCLVKLLAIPSFILLYFIGGQPFNHIFLEKKQILSLANVCDRATNAQVS